MTAPMLAGDLATAVPAAIGAVADWSPERRTKEADGYADAIASGADILWADPATTKRAEISPDQVRDALVNGLAILAHRPGGVTFGGLHWHANPTTCTDCHGAGTWTIPTDSTTRESRGAFFTPRALAEEIVANALGVVTQPTFPAGRAADITSVRVADIACGSGAFLVAAARYLSDKLVAAWDEEAKAEVCDTYDTTDPLMAARAEVFWFCLHGVDIDPLSVEMARLALQLLTPAFQTADGYLGGLRVGDALVGRSHPDYDTATEFPATAARFDWPAEFPHIFAHPTDPACGFDAIIGNAPFLGGQKIAGALGATYRDHLVRALAGGKRGSADLAAYFWLRAHELVAEYGVVGFVTTNTLLQGATARVGRDQLAQRGWRPYREVPFRAWPSKSAAVCCCLVWTHLRVYPPVELRALESAL
jgi:hypothetical protein